MFEAAQFPIGALMVQEPHLLNRVSRVKRGPILRADERRETGLVVTRKCVASKEGSYIWSQVG